MSTIMDASQLCGDILNMGRDLIGGFSCIALTLSLPTAGIPRYRYSAARGERSAHHCHSPPQLMHLCSSSAVLRLMRAMPETVPIAFAGRGIHEHIFSSASVTLCACSPSSHMSRSATAQSRSSPVLTIKASLTSSRQGMLFERIASHQ